MKNVPLAILCLLLSLPLVAQDDHKLKWGKVSESDLAMTQYDSDPDASAVVLDDFGQLHFDYSNGSARFRLDRHRRVKVLTRAGFDEGNIQLRYVSYSNEEKIENLKVQVFLPDGTKISVDKDYIFKEEENDYWSVIKIVIPNLVEGAIFEYRYSLLSERILSLRPWYFQEDIPIRYSELRTEIPEWLDYVYLREGDKLDIDETDIIKRSMTIPRTGVDQMGFSRDRGYQTVNAGINVHRFAMKDVPGLKQEPFITTMEDYYAHIKFQLRSINYEGSPSQPVFSDWATVCSELEQSESFGKQLDNPQLIRDAWRELQNDLSGTTDDIGKAHAIYNFLAPKMNWNGYGGFMIDKNLKSIYADKSGSAGELNLLLIALLKKAELNAIPLLTSTRENGKMFELYPFVNQFNHVFAAVLIGDQAILMDLGNKDRPAGLISVGSLNKRALVVDSSNPIWIDIPATTSKDVYFARMNVDESGMISGTMKTSQDGYSALYYRDVLRSESVASIWQDEFDTTFPGCEISELSVEGQEDVYSKLKQEVEFVLPGGGQVAGDFIYVNPVIYSDFLENPFSLEVRAYPVDMPYPVEEKGIFNLDFPEGYTLESSPEPIRLALPGNAGLFQYNVSGEGNNLQVVVDLKLSMLYFSAVDYPTIKSFFDAVEEKLNEPVVLKRL